MFFRMIEYFDKLGREIRELQLDMKWLKEAYKKLKHDAEYTRNEYQVFKMKAPEIERRLTILEGRERELRSIIEKNKEAAAATTARTTHCDKTE